MNNKFIYFAVALKLIILTLRNRRLLFTFNKIFKSIYTDISFNIYFLLINNKYTLIKLLVKLFLIVILLLFINLFILTLTLEYNRFSSRV